MTLPRGKTSRHPYLRKKELAWAARQRRKAAKSGVMKKQITGNFASRMEQFSLACTAGTVYDFNFNLNDLDVCKQLADAYQYYRVTSIELRFKPNTDTFISNGSGGSSTGFIPYLNFQYDKTGGLAGNIDADNFEQMGTKAYRLDDKTLTRRWKPSVVTDIDAVGTTQFKVSPWLPTHENIANTLNVVNHYGATFYISKTNANDTQVYDVDVVVNVQFRKPYIEPAENAQSINPPRVKQGPTSGHLESTPIVS